MDGSSALATELDKVRLGGDDNEATRSGAETARAADSGDTKESSKEGSKVEKVGKDEDVRRNTEVESKQVNILPYTEN